MLEFLTTLSFHGENQLSETKIRAVLDESPFHRAEWRKISQAAQKDPSEAIELNEASLALRGRNTGISI